MVTSDLHALLAVLVSPPECLSKDHCREIPLQLLLAIAPFHLLVRQIGHPPGWPLREIQILWRVVWMALVDTPWAWASFMALSRWSFSTSAAISVMGTFAWGTSDLLLPPPVSPPLPFDNPLHLHSRRGLVMVDPLDNFLNLLKLFLTIASNFTKSQVAAMMAKLQGVRRER